jgi:Spy/CpxP family protein refolding chaperone
MHSAFMSWGRAAREHPICGGYGVWRGRGHGGHPWGEPGGGFEEGFGTGGFGVRRPLRFLAHELGLDERQMAELARILDDLKTERAQAEVDRRRTVAAFADALAGDTFDVAKAGEGGELRVRSAERLRGAVVQALQRMHAILNSEQRARLAYLIRTGALTV